MRQNKCAQSAKSPLLQSSDTTWKPLSPASHSESCSSWRVLLLPLLSLSIQLRRELGGEGALGAAETADLEMKIWLELTVEGAGDE